MTLYIDHGDGFAPSCAYHDLYQISDTDDGLGDKDVAGDDSVKQVTYTETPGVWATAGRLNTVVNTDFGKPIVITGLPSGVQNPYSGGVADLTGNGETWQDTSSGTVVIRVVYDVGQCNANGVYVYDTNGNQIPMPNEVMLYHELSHAYHYATNTVAATVDLEEQAAETDENVLRDEEGLTERDITNHDGGCGIDPAPPACTADTSSGGSFTCFIVSAAAGSPYAGPVNSLRRTRDLFVRRSSVASELFDRGYQEYYRFSPDVAMEIASDAALARLVLNEVVIPLVGWYELLAASCQAGSEPQHEAAAARLLATLSPSQVSAMAAVLHEVAPGVSPQETPSGLAYLISQAEEAGAWTPLARWAAGTPLALLSDHVARGRSPGELLDAMGRWLSQVPLSAITVPGSRADLAREAEELASIFTDLRFRHAIGAALLSRLEGTASFDVADVLTERGLLAEGLPDERGS